MLCKGIHLPIGSMDLKEKVKKIKSVLLVWTQSFHLKDILVTGLLIYLQLDNYSSIHSVSLEEPNGGY